MGFSITRRKSGNKPKAQITVKRSLRSTTVDKAPVAPHTPDQPPDAPYPAPEGYRWERYGLQFDRDNNGAIIRKKKLYTLVKA